MNTASELKDLANKLGINLECIWLKDYSTNDKPTILNLGNAFTGGTHFVAIYKNQYFDPFGMDPPPIVMEKNPIVQWKDVQIQSLKTGHCGIYCVCFLYYAIHDDLETFYKSFTKMNNSILRLR